MRRPVVKYGDPILEKVAEPVTNFNTPELRQLIKDMFETMYDSRGVGLAAPQVSVGQRLAIVDTSAGEDPQQPFVMINPEIVLTEGSQTGEEGCLSIPGFREDVTRPNKVKIRAQNEKGEWFEKEGDELLARAILHENDHLNGVLFLSHLSALKRELIRRKIKRLQRAGEW
jgi:peptide deformylase